MTERNGRPGRRYDDMPQQNQSPVVTDEMVDAGWSAVSPGFMNSRADIRRVLEAALPSGGVKPVREDEELIAACKAHDKEEAAQMGEPSPWEVNKDDIDPEWVSSRVAAMRCAMAALPSGVRVKPLEWVLDKPAMGDRYTAQSSFGEYTVRLKDGYMWEPGNESFPSTHDDPKAAAQADYESRILSAIDPTPSHAETVAPYAAAPAPDELEVVAWRKRLSDIDGHVTYSNVQIDDDYEPLVRLTDAQAAIAAKDEEIERLRGVGKIALKSSGRSLKRAETAEAKVEELTRDLEAAMDRNWVSRPEYERVFALYKTAEARVAELEKALEPFARHLDEMKFDLDHEGNKLPDDQPVGWVYVTNGDFRRARSALHPEREG